MQPRRTDSSHRPKVNRRIWLRRSLGGLTAAAILSGLYAWRIEPHWYELVLRDLPIASLPSNLDGARMIHISDLHVGTVDSDYLIKAFRQVKRLKPDILVCTGDWIQCEGTKVIDKVSRVLQHLKPARLGTLGVLGNHDYSSTWRNPELAEQVSKFLEEQGITMLRNSTSNLQGLKFIGLDELWSGNFDLSMVKTDIDNPGAKLMLCHNPDAADMPGWNNYKGWILSGHTHGGQCKPPFLKAPIIPVKNKRYSAGVIDLFDGRKLYINRALGYVHRIRFNVRPEITVFTLRTAV